MKLLRTSDVLLMLARHVLLVYVAGATGLLFGCFFKLLAYAIFALLLFFVVGRSAALLKTVAIRLQALASAFFCAGATARRVRCLPPKLALPDQPLRPSLFQRPPPLYSL